MTANELADAMGIRASIRRQATSRKSVQEGADDRLADQLEQAATMLRQQTQEIGELKLRISQLLETQDYLYKKHDSDKAKIEELKQIIDANNLQSDIGQLKKAINMIKPVAWMDKNGYVYGKHSTRPIEADIPLYTHSNTQSHPIEQVAMRYDFDGYGYKYIDSGSGSDWKTRENGEFLYTKPFFSQKPVAMMVKIDGFDKPEFTTTCSSAALKHPNYTALYDHPPIAFAELEEGQSIPLYEHPETVEDRESAIYATGYWNGIQKAKEKNETLDTRSYLIGRYDGLRELSDATIRELSVAFMLVLRRTSEDELFESVYEYSKLLLKKARGQ